MRGYCVYSQCGCNCVVILLAFLLVLVYPDRGQAFVHMRTRLAGGLRPRRPIVFRGTESSSTPTAVIDDMHNSQSTLPLELLPLSAIKSGQKSFANTKHLYRNASTGLISYKGKDCVTLLGAEPVASYASISSLSSTWSVQVHHASGWLLMGIIGAVPCCSTSAVNTSDSASAKAASVSPSSTLSSSSSSSTPSLLTYSDSSCFGWATDEYLVRGGRVVQSADPDWRGWRSGDKATFTLDRSTRLLQMQHEHQSEKRRLNMAIEAGELSEVLLYVHSNRPFNITFTTDAINHN